MRVDMNQITKSDLPQTPEERRYVVERIIHKLATLDRPEHQQTYAAQTQPLSVKHILDQVNTVAELVQWAKLNFEASDVVFLETKLQRKLNLYPQRAEDLNYCRLIALVFYLMAGNQCARVYGVFSHRAIRAAFSTQLDMYHPLHVLECASYIGELTVQVYVYKARIGEALATVQDCPLTTDQERILAQLCLLPVDNQPLGPLHFDHVGEDPQTTPAAYRPAPPGINLWAILDAVNSAETGHSTLTQRRNLDVPAYVNPARPGQMQRVAYVAPNLGLCLQLRGILTVNDIKKSAADVLLDKLTRLWEILLPLGIDLAAMTDFQ